MSAETAGTRQKSLKNFETIHPFLDGNGRTGRLLIILYLIGQDILLKPTLYLSDYLEKKRQEYFDSLNEARLKNDIVQWIRFFLGAVIETSKKGCHTFDGILSLWNEVNAALLSMGTKAKNASSLFSHLFQNPVLSLTNDTTLPGMSNKTLRRLVSELEEKKYLEETTGQGRNKSFVFKRYLNLF